LKFNGIEHFDHFTDETIFWAEISDVPAAIQEEAKKIDGDEYHALCFGMCICYDWAEKEFAIVTDTDLSTGSPCNIYYIDNDGDKHWFQMHIPDEFARQVFAVCGRINEGKETEYDYEVQKTVLFENCCGFVLVKNTAAKNPFATWLFTEDEKGRRDYFNGHYHPNRDEAAKDFATRSADYQRFHAIREVKRPIAEQMKEAAKLAGNNRSKASHKKDTPDRGDR